jgi:hypothetical protein
MQLKVKRFENMFVNMKSGGGIPKELLLCLEANNNTMIEPEELIDGTTPEEIMTTDEQEEEEEGVLAIEINEDIESESV